MSFKKKTQAEYRAMSLDDLNLRKEEIVAELQDSESEVSTDDLVQERDMCMDAIKRCRALDSLADAEPKETFTAQNAKQALETITRSKGVEVAKASDVTLRERDTSDILSSMEYRKAFARQFTEGVKLPKELELAVRANQFTTVATDAGSVVPTQLQDKLIQEEHVFGTILNGVTKTSYPGGITIPTANFDVQAKWITESKVSDTQKLAPSGMITFSYYGLEVRVAQSFLTAAITLSAFESEFAKQAAQAMVRAKEQGILNGTGTGQMKGICTETGLTKIALAEADFAWKPMHQKFKAKIPVAYRGGTLIMAQGTWDAMFDGMVDTNGQPVARIDYGINGEEQMRFAGIPVMTVENSVIADYADTAANGVFALYTRLSDYVINSALPYTAVNWRDEETNQLKYKILEYLDGKLVNPYGTILLTKPSA